MKKLLCWALIGLLLLISSPAKAADTVNLNMDGQIIMAEPAPYIDAASGRTMVPLRLISEYLGWQVAWDANLRQATISNEYKTITFIINSTTAYIDDLAQPLDVAATIYQDSTMVPLRFIIENFEADISWDAASRTVYLALTKAMPAMAEASFDEQIDAEIGYQPLISGYYFDTASWDMLEAYSADFDTIIHFGYKMFADGSIEPKNYNSAYAEKAEPLADELSIEKILLITNFGDPSLVGKHEDMEALLNNASTRAQAVANIVQLVTEEEADGVDLDFELMKAATRDSLTAFVQELKSALPDKLITLSLPPKREQDTWQQAFDYQALGEAADRIHIMFYDQHYGGSEPGPVAEPNWITQGLDYLTGQIPAEKLHLMLGAYGRSWGIGSPGQSIRYQQALDLAAQNGVAVQRDEVSQVPYIKYANVEIWFEDEISLAAKAALAEQYQLGGIGLWRMGMPNDAMWQAILGK